MTTRFARFISLSPQDRGVVLCAALLMPAFHLALKVFGLARLLAFLDGRRRNEVDSHPPLTSLKNLGALVNGAANNSLVPANCLTRSLVLSWMLARRGVAGQLRIGVRRVAGSLDAHAWVECGGEPINDAFDIATRFAPLQDQDPLPDASVVLSSQVRG